ncbi:MULTISPECIES: VCBS repeat-containing protein [unclassified Mucilaginibacter]|uniref:VCBS repeat-containing protein n=1 Tax=unclassified Mucilaginibacter TaxID=2617802 RepID=UPI002AC926A2|nr:MULTISPECIES: VCBS repeat-containing protein [unclassified Mucilaginibacter]MEB0263414.1 VCBS repeat-containing protein [Mucilaginibacter sp. 10I4]MEB0280112.1 VCBS repeat-containing protein [Mucilaginibacter sp. 10B2]MEB0301052.1 VCBS repeat-containing protein [Mucilaginibacter sp. 5C4]WPX24479.1 VCBS repeat-containing protein [Mucilaginibacter sp. 5C4]
MQLFDIYFLKTAVKVAVICIAVAFFAPALSIAQQPLFKLLPGAQTGIKFSNDIVEKESLNVLSYEYFYNGGGVATGDINNDGLPDLMFTANMKPNKLYLNLGGLKFKDITKEASPYLEGRPNGWKTGVTMADVNGDGLLDIYICYSGKTDNETRSNQLFINQGNNKFTEEAKAYGLADPGYSTQAAFFDYDNDGDLDMFLLNHNIKKIDNMELARYKNETDQLASNKLYRNDNGHFTDVSKEAGIIQNPLTFGLGIAIADINKDGWPDIYVTNDYNEPDYIYINTHDGKFAEHSKDMLRHMSHFSMGIDIADFNNDGLPDIITLDMMPEDNHRQKSLQLQENYELFALMQNQGLYNQYMRNMLQLNNGDGTFSEIAQLAGLSNTDWSWCPLIADLDNDGYKDIFITNGYLRDYTNKDFLRYWGDYKIKKAMAGEPFLLMDLVMAMPSTSLPNYVFKNNHNLTFTKKQVEWGLNDPGISSSAVYVDLDNDGDLDLVVNNINQPAFVYQNTGRDNNNNKASYLAVKLNGTGKNTNAIGAKVYVYSAGNMQYQEVNPNRGYLSCVSSTLNFGLGNTTEVDSIRIIWPDQSGQLLTKVKANQLLSVKYNPSKKLYITAVKAAASIFKPAPAIINFKPEEITINDFKRQLLMLFMYSRTAPVVTKADVNGDGLEDLFISGDKDSAGKIYLQQKGGTYQVIDIIRGKTEDIGTTAAAEFFDANGDGKPDLYIAKGGYSNYEPNTAALQDELYLNEGNGRFVLSPTALPVLNANSKACVKPYDFDGDGDIDLFIGGRVIPGKYPVAPESYLLVNDGKGKFTIANIPFAKAGMVTDAQWVDLNNDARKDLVLCGEFMPITILINTKEGFKDKTQDYFAAPLKGFWFKIAFADVNGDGKPDLIAGNIGQNSQIHASEKEPADLYYADFDNNGSIDPFFNFYLDGKSYPFVSRDELNEQIYPMRRRFSSYKAYADATINEIFTPKELATATKLSISTTQTTLFINQNGKFVAAALPIQAQFAPVSQILTNDFDHDGKTDLLLLGNHADNRLKIGSMDANYGCLLKGDGKGGFTYVEQSVSGLSITGDVKAALEIQINKAPYLLIGTSEGPLKFYKE